MLGKLPNGELLAREEIQAKIAKRLDAVNLEILEEDNDAYSMTLMSIRVELEECLSLFDPYPEKE